MSSIIQLCQGATNINSLAPLAKFRCGGSPQESNGDGHSRAVNALPKFASTDTADCVRSA
jgi:hypothetical protein